MISKMNFLRVTIAVLGKKSLEDIADVPHDQLNLLQ